MVNNIVLPKVLIDSGISLDTHIFRYRADRDFTIGDGESSITKNIVIEEIARHSIWHSAVGALNDPFEIYARSNLQEFAQMTEEQKLNLWVKIGAKLGYPGLMALSSSQIYEAYQKDKLRLREIVHDVTRSDTSFDSFIQEIRETVGIACFTSVCNSRLMWGYYCNGLSGVCLIYNTSSLLQQRVELNPVKYLEGAFEVNVLDFVYNYKDEVRANTLSQIVKTKHTEWAHEIESRSVADLQNEEIGVGRLIEMKQACIEGVIVGRNVRDDVKIAIEKLSKQFGFKIFKADVDYQLFGVKIS